MATLNASSRPLRRRAGRLTALALILSAPALAPASAQVEVQPLAKLDLFSTGREAGFGMDLWKGASADIARAVIPILATRPLSPAGTSLARRLLAQSATAPDGAGGDADLAAARVKALLALGEAPLAGEILDHTPNLAANSPLSQTAAEVALDLGQDDKACAIGDALTVDRGGIYWLRLRAYCQAVAGKTEAAQLTFTLAGQQAKDPTLTRLMTPVVTGAGAPGPASLRNGLEYALSRRLKLDLTPALPGASPPIAEQVMAANAASPAAGLAGAEPPAAPVPPTETDLITPLRAAKTFAAFVTAAKLAQPTIAALVQAKTPLAEPTLLASAALAAGDLDSAQAIRAGLDQPVAAPAPAEPSSPAPAAPPPVAAAAPNALDLVLLDAALAAAQGKPDAITLDHLVERGGTGDPKSKARAQAAAGIFAGLGGDMSDNARSAFIGFDLGRGDASAARLITLDADAEAGRVGETALLALLVAQGGGAAGPPPPDRARIIRALSRVGRKGDAQAFAVEGLLSLQAR